MTEKSYQSLHLSFGRSLPISLGRHLKIIGCDISFHQMICKVENQQWCLRNKKMCKYEIFWSSGGSCFGGIYFSECGQSVLGWWTSFFKFCQDCLFVSSNFWFCNTLIENSITTILKLQLTVIQIIHIYLYVSVSDNFCLSYNFWWDTLRRRSQRNFCFTSQQQQQHLSKRRKTENKLG